MTDLERRRIVLAIGSLMALAGLDTQRWGAMASAPASRLPLWPNDPPGGGGPAGAMQISPKGAVTNIAEPALEVLRPKRPNGAAMLIAGGGGYKRIEIEKEARPAAHWLCERGITAYTLFYRLPAEGWRQAALAPLQDAQRALRVIRAQTPGPVGVLGFSAGGHLLGLAASRSEFASYAPQDALDQTTAHADLAALIYPVVTLQPPLDHTSTRVQLIGHHPSPEQSAYWSVQTHIDAHCPPMFLVQAQDDPISNIANTALLAHACRRAGVAVQRHVLPCGGHGFAMGDVGRPSGHWPGWFQAWLRQHRLLG